MANEQIERAVRDVAGPDASERKVQALVWAVEKYGIEWLKNYQQRQRRQSTDVRQRTSRQRITLDWSRHRSLGDAPAANIRELGGWRLLHRLSRVHTQDGRPHQRLGWQGRGPRPEVLGRLHVPRHPRGARRRHQDRCPGRHRAAGCRTDARIKELEESLAAANDRASQSDRERAALENSNGEMQDELETLRGDKGDLANKLDTKVRRKSTDTPRREV